MAGKEEGSMEAAKWTLRPCTTAGKSEKDAVAGDGDQGPAMRRPTERKKVAGYRYKEGDQPPEGWIDVYKQAEPASSDPFGLQRRAASIDKMLGEAKLPAASVVSKQGADASAAPAAAATGKKLKRRLKKSEIRDIIVLKPESFPDADYLDDLAKYESAEWIAERKKQHEEDAAYFGKMDEEYEEFRQQVIKGVREKGYYEVDYDYPVEREKQASNVYAGQVLHKADVSKLLRFVATPEEEEERRRDGDGYQAYVPDEDDDVLDGVDSDEEEEEDEEEDEEGAELVHKIPLAQLN